MLDTAIMVLGKIFTAAGDYKSLLQSETAMLRAFYFEIETNINMLNAIDTNRLTGERVYSKAVRPIVNNLEMPIASSIIFSDDKLFKRLYSQFSKVIEINEIVETDDSNNKPNPKKKTPLQAMIFILQKITILQKLSSYEGEPEEGILKKMLLKIRIENIRTHLERLKDFMLELDKSKNFLIK